MYVSFNTKVRRTVRIVTGSPDFCFVVFVFHRLLIIKEAVAGPPRAETSSPASAPWATGAYHLGEHLVHLRLVRGGQQRADLRGVGHALRHAALQRGRLAHQPRAQRHVLARARARAAAPAPARAPQHALQHVRVLRHVVQAAPQLHHLAPLPIWTHRTWLESPARSSREIRPTHD